MTYRVFNIVKAALCFVVCLSLPTMANDAAFDLVIDDSAAVGVDEIIELPVELTEAPAPIITDADESVQFTSSTQCYKGDVWEVSTRHMPCCFNLATVSSPNFRVSHIENGRWVSRTAQELFDATAISESTDFPPLTIYYVHGNWMTVENTRERVQTINRSLSRHAQRPFHLVCLSWPSEREFGFVANIRENAACADTNAHYLNYLIEHTSPSSQISLMGFSLGARTVTGALHLQGGGTINGITNNLGSGESVARTFRVTLIAPAVDRNWLAPNGKYHAAMSVVDSLVNLYNSQDPVLRRFRFINRNRVSDAIAAGFRGFGGIMDPRSTTPLNPGRTVEQFDCGPVVGNSHDEKTYYSRCSHYTKGAKNVLWFENTVMTTAN